MYAYRTIFLSIIPDFAVLAKIWTEMFLQPKYSVQQSRQTVFIESGHWLHQRENNFGKILI